MSNSLSGKHFKRSGEEYGVLPATNRVIRCFLTGIKSEEREGVILIFKSMKWESIYRFTSFCHAIKTALPAHARQSVLISCASPSQAQHVSKLIQ